MSDNSLEFDIEISFNTIINKVKKQLSLIGKRAFTNDGKSMFSKVTISSLEEPALYGYIKSGVEKIASNFRDFLTVADFPKEDDKITIHLNNSRWVSSKDNAANPQATAFGEEVFGYLVSFVLAEYLMPNFEQLSERFTLDANNHMLSMSRLVYYKIPPEKSTASYSDIQGTINK